MSGLARMTYAGLAAAGSPGMIEAKVAGEGSPGDKVGRPVRISSISFPNGKWFPVDQIVPYVDKAGAAGVDVIALPEVCTGQNDKSEEDLSGPTVMAMSALAKKHKMYIVLPMDRRNKNLRPIPRCFLVGTERSPAFMMKSFHIGRNMNCTLLSTSAMTRWFTARISAC